MYIYIYIYMFIFIITSLVFILCFLTRSKMDEKQEVIKIWRNADAVCFDVDSTVCQGEAIDELAKFCGVGKKVEML